MRTDVGCVCVGLRVGLHGAGWGGHTDTRAGDSIRGGSIAHLLDERGRAILRIDASDGLHVERQRELVLLRADLLAVGLDRRPGCNESA